MLFFGRLKIVISAIILSVFIINSPGISQDDARLQFFEGGAIDFNFYLRSNLLTGAGVSGALTGMTASQNPSPFAVFGNPANLGRMTGRQLSIGFSPQIEFAVQDFSDPAPTVKEEVDNALDTFQKIKPPVYPVVTGIVGRPGSAVTGLAMSFAFDKSKKQWFNKIPRLLDVLALGYNQPMYLHLESVYSGLRMRLRTIDDQPETEILFYSSIKMTANMTFSADSWTIAGAKRVNKFWFGFGLMRTDINADLTGHLRTDGIMSMAGIKFAFNDPNVRWNNDYNTDLDAILDGTSIGTRFGVTYAPTERILFGADMRLQSEVVMEGPLDITMNLFKALKLTAEAGEKKFDVNSISADELTRTIPKNFDVTSDIIFNIPSAFSIAGSYGGVLSPHLTFTKYFGELAYSMTMTEDDAEFNYKRGFKPEWSGMLGLDLSALRIAFGATKLADVQEGYHDANGLPIKTLDPLIIPHFSLGFDMVVAENLTFGALLLGLPEDAIRFTLNFEF